MTLTKADIHRLASPGRGWNRDQLRLLCVPWPPPSGWVRRLVGVHVAPSLYAEALRLKDARPKPDPSLPRIIPTLQAFWKSYGGKGRNGQGFPMEAKIQSLIRMADVRVFSKRQAPLKARRRAWNWIKTGKKGQTLYRICFVCGKDAECRHHIIQLQHGGRNMHDNVVGLCNRCHAEIHPWLNDQKTCKVCNGTGRLQMQWLGTPCPACHPSRHIASLPLPSPPTLSCSA